MKILHVCHNTAYHYRWDVFFGPHRLMLWPRASHDLRVISTEITCTPAAKLSWVHDSFGNSIGLATFSEPSSTLKFESRLQLELYASEWPIFPISTSATQYPFQYSEDEIIDLGAMRVPQYLDPEGRLLSWAQSFIRGPATDTLSLLKDINAGITQKIFYQSREDEGTQSPLDTLALQQGSCRDIAVLMIEAVRALGFGARVVSGYLYISSPNVETLGSSGAGSTHAWVEIFLPGAGWIVFDPTNRTMGGANLIPLASARNIQQVAPISGSFTGAPNDFLGMDVEITVREQGLPP